MKATLLPDGPTTTSFERPEFYHYEEDETEVYWCEECRDHHPERHRIFDGYGEMSALFVALEGYSFTSMLLEHDNGTEYRVEIDPFVPNGGTVWVPIS